MRLIRLTPLILLFISFQPPLYALQEELSEDPDLQEEEVRTIWAQDFARMMEIPRISALESSPTHLYLLSSEEGMAVFRTGGNIPTWLYTSEGMERRGDRLVADVRFGYLWGDGTRLTVVEPTSVLGVYSATMLPERPVDVQRLGNRIYIAFENGGLGTLSLETPDELDSDPQMLLRDQLDGRPALSLASDQVSRLWVLAGGETLFLLERTDEDWPATVARTVELDQNFDRIFLQDEYLIGSRSDGGIYYINEEGESDQIGRIDTTAQRIFFWEDRMAVQTVDGGIWIGQPGGELNRWQEESGRTFHAVLIGEDLWVGDDDRLSPLVEMEVIDSELDEVVEYAGPDQQPELNPIDEITVPVSRPVILPIDLVSGHNPAEIDFSYSSNVRNASIRGQSFYWQPNSNQIGRHQFTVTATTTTGRSASIDFTIHVRPFNTPPRITPVRDITLNVDEEFSFEIQAVDPDGIDPSLIRYLGVDLPNGARLDEQTGEFVWTPGIRQVGEHEFQVIATDQYGAATSERVRLRVIETDPEAEAEID